MSVCDFSSAGLKGDPGNQMEATQAVKEATSKAIPTTPVLSTPRRRLKIGKAVAPRTPTRAEQATKPPSKDSSTHCIKVKDQVIESKPRTVMKRKARPRPAISVRWVR